MTGSQIFTVQLIHQGDSCLAVFQHNSPMADGRIYDADIRTSLKTSPFLESESASREASSKRSLAANHESAPSRTTVGSASASLTCTWHWFSVGLVKLPREALIYSSGTVPHGWQT